MALKRWFAWFTMVPARAGDSKMQDVRSARLRMVHQAAIVRGSLMGNVDVAAALTFTAIRDSKKRTQWPAP